MEYVLYFANVYYSPPVNSKGTYSYPSLKQDKLCNFQECWLCSSWNKISVEQGWCWKWQTDMGQWQTVRKHCWARVVRSRRLASLQEHSNQDLRPSLRIECTVVLLNWSRSLHNRLDHIFSIELIFSWLSHRCFKHTKNSVVQLIRNMKWIDFHSQSLLLCISTVVIKKNGKRKR